MEKRAERAGRFDHVLVHYGELALKGGNRPIFEKTLIENISRALAGLHIKAVRKLYGRLVVDLAPDSPWEEVRQRLGRVCGVVNFSPAHRVEATLEDIEAAVDEATSQYAFDSFRVQTKRADKSFPLNTPELNAHIGARVQAATGAAVDLSDAADLTLLIEIVSGTALVACERHPGPGGLPVGVSGRVACMLSGGIDSPVAAYTMLKRGCLVDFVHFHSYPYTDRASVDKALEVAELLTRFQNRASVSLVPFAEVQQRIVAETPAHLRIILYRRFMVRISEVIAQKLGAKALVTGESLGQVSSQTLTNITTIEAAAAAMPILRPLIGMDKQEIISLARAIGTYEVSIQPHDDCCSFLMPRRPATRSTPEELEAAEAALDVEALVSMSLEGVETKRLTWP
ncbi:MAG: tRNA 4-thiouridine(8) synthase ThiI [Nitrospinae bacterium]|nr:tRNA 4-thiouridine(8) synthase ThiI [Nitrospinota bacterium]